MNVVRRMTLRTLGCLCTFASGVLICGAPAFAAAPEVPETGPASEVSNTTAVLNGTLNPHSASLDGWFFEYNAGAGCAGGNTTPIEPEIDVETQAEHAEVSGLAPNTQYAFCLVARNEAGETAVGPASTVTTSSVAPSIGTESFSAVGSTSATIRAQVNAMGSSSSVYFQYGTDSSYGKNTSDFSIGAAHVNTSVSALLEGLQPDTIYHFRVVAENALGTTYGDDASFTTYSAATTLLPDERLPEMVSPDNNENANIYTPAGEIVEEHEAHLQTYFPFQTSPDGSAVTYVGDPTSGGNGSDGGLGNQYLATRSASGWTQVNIQPPGYRTPIYQGFSSNLSVGFLESCDRSLPPLSPNAPGGGYDVLYSHSNNGAYDPLFDVLPPNRSREEFKSVDVLGHGVDCAGSLAYAGSSSDIGHVLFEANDALTANAAENPPTSEQNDLYDSVDGQLSLVNVLPGSPGRADPNATFGSDPPSTNGFASYPDFSHVISTDGSRIFWTDMSTGNLYVRESDGRADARTVQVDASVHGGGQYWTASANGSVVFYTKEGDLYAFNTDDEETHDLVPSGEVQGLVGASEDGSYVYFVADASLTAGAISGEPNLYLIYFDGTKWESPTFIATLSPEDDAVRSAHEEAQGDWQAGLGNRTAEVTPDGHNVVFMSNQPLTGYAEQVPRNGRINRDEVYVYDAESSRLSCASCNPSGAPPVATGEAHGTDLPISNGATYLLRWISGDGSRVFFDSSESLVPQDNNGVLDVYEWERFGAGSCLQLKGCIYLLSGATSSDNSYFADASANGDDVFLVTRAKLTSQDQNDDIDIYDIRAGASEPLSQPACSGSGCQGVPPAPPIFATPSSVTFSGVGNFAPAATKVLGRKAKPKRCKRGYREKHKKCVRSRTTHAKHSARAKKNTRVKSHGKRGTGNV